MAPDGRVTDSEAAKPWVQRRLYERVSNVTTFKQKWVFLEI
jgi:hypothetical protein